MGDRVVFNNQAANHIQAYLDYDRIVGDADGGKMMSEKEFEEFKLKQQEMSKYRIFAQWRNSKGMECKNIGPSSTCFCGHRFKEHEFMNPKNKKVICKRAKCSCPCYSHVPVFGSHDFKCLCKHSYTEHDPITKKCTKGQCGCNQRFQSGWSCSCGQKYGEHITVIETRQERIAAGKSVDDLNNPMGLPSFQSLVDGADGYAAQIDQLGGMQPAIGYQQQKQLLNEGDEDRKNKLKNLNSKFGPKDQIDKFVEQQQQVQIQPNMGVSMLQLYNTPHIYATASVGSKQKRLKY